MTTDDAVMGTGRDKAIIYCRTSSEDLAQTGKAGGKVSIEQQEKTCREYAVRQGLVVESVFADHDQTGRAYWSGAAIAEMDTATSSYMDRHHVRQKQRSREGLAKALAALRPGIALIVRTLERLARPVPDAFLWQALP